MSFRGGVDQLPFAALVLEPPAELPEVEPVPVVRAPESLTEVATTVPLEFFTPWTTTASPGCSELLETLRLFASLVLEERVTLTVFPLVSVR